MFTLQQQGCGRIGLRFFIGVVLAVLLSINGFAAEAQKGKTAGAKADMQEGEAILSQKGFRASKIIDHTVKNGQGEELGEVDDFIMSRNGKIKKVVLSVGGFLGIGDRLVAVPFRSLQITGGDIFYKITREQLEKHPAFSFKDEGLYEYYYDPAPPYGSLGLRPRGVYHPPYGQPYAPFPPRGRYRGEFGPHEWEYFPERLRVSAILNRDALNNKGEEVGEIEDLIINRDGKAKQIILSLGGFLGIDEKRVGLPFSPLKITDLGIVCNVSREELKSLPAFTY
jgi:sporulation protein YlmC with PRC-barrel domain